MKTLARFFRRSRCGVITAFALVLTIRAWCQAPDGNLGFMITSPSLNTYRLEWFGQSGKKFQLQSSADLSFWSNTGPVITGVGGIITAEDGPISLLRKFYRVGIIGAVRLLPITGVLPGNDDGSIAGAVPIGFTINFLASIEPTRLLTTTAISRFPRRWLNILLSLSKITQPGL